MASETRTVAVHKIFLDNENPRHPPIEHEGEIIAKLVIGEKVRGLAEDIVAYGVSPLDRMGVVPHPKIRGAFIAVEGNRRLCAVKLLADPEKAPSEPHKKVFRALKSKLKAPISALEVVVFDDRAAARHWMTIRHEGEQDGAGTKNWKAPQIARFNAGGSQADNPNILANELLDYAVKRKLITQDEHEKISITTLTRFLNGPLFRDTLGLMSNKELTTDAPQEEFDKGIARFLRDARTAGSDVHSRTNADQREQYRRKLLKEGVVPKTRTGHATRIHPENGTIDPQPGSGGGSTRDNRSPDKRKNIIPSDFHCHIANKVHKRIYDELKKIDAEDHPFAGAYLLRAFIELTTRSFCKKHRIISGKPELHHAIGLAADFLQNDQKIPAKELKALRVMSKERDSAYSPESLGAAVHGGLIPSRADLNKHWDTMEADLRLMLDRL
jgi:hypothetical protein